MKVIPVTCRLQLVEHVAIEINDEEKTTEEDRSDESSLETCEVHPSRYGQTSQVGMTTVQGNEQWVNEMHMQGAPFKFP